MAFEAVPLLDQRFSGYFVANSLTSREARTIRRASRRDSKIPQACPAGYLCFVASQSGTASKAMGVEFSSVELGYRVPFQTS